MSLYLSAARAPIDLADGRVLAPLERVELDGDDAHDARLIAEGVLIPADPPVPRAARTTTHRKER